MALSHSPSIITNGLTFYYDMGNTQKSWKGAPTTNLITNPDWQLGTDNNFTGWFRSDATNINVVRSKYLGEDCIKLTRNSGDTGYDGIRTSAGLSLSTSTTYTENIVYAVPYNMSQPLRFYTPERTNGVVTDYRHYLTALNATSGWQTFKYTFTTSATATSWDGVSIDWNTTTSTQLETVFIKSIQLEQGSFATPFVNGTRSNTQAILDLTNRNTVTASSLAYNSNNTFSFNGINSGIISSQTAAQMGITTDLTISIFTNRSSSPTNALQGQAGFGTGGSISIKNSGNYFADINSTTLTRYIVNISTDDTMTPYENNWANLCVTVSGTTIRTYLNGVLKNTQVMDSTIKSFGSELFGIGNGYGYFRMQGSVSLAKIYNRALTQEEIRQNFNAIRGRYGI